MQKVDFCVIIPAFNEGSRIERTIDSIKSVHDCEIVAVDDGSTDNTVIVARSAGATVLSLPFNMGYGVALQTGFKYALSKGYRFVVHMDADGQHDPKDISQLIDVVRRGDADVVLGSRFMIDTGYRMPMAKRIGAIIFSRIVSLVTGQKVTDSTTGFQALNHRALRLYGSRAYPVDFPDADVLIMIHRLGLSFREVPVHMLPNPKDITMHSGIVSFYYIFKMFLSILVTLLRKIPHDWNFRKEQEQ